MALVFPALPGLAWSVTKTPVFETRIQRAMSGRELRALDYPYPLWQFTLDFSVLRDDPAAGFDEFRTLLGFFLACQGAYGEFLFQDPTDFAVAGQGLGTGDASTTGFQLLRMIGGFAEPIVAPDQVTAIYFNGVTQSASGYSVDADTGVVTFAAPPPPGLAITADFTFYFRCRFVDDRYDFDNFMYRLWQVKKLTFISVRP
jgi:uncharacterized protein (TIGR02217 family)